MRLDPTKEFLMSARWAHSDARRLRRKVEELTTQVEHITASYSGMPSGGGGDSTNAWAALAQLRADYLASQAKAELQEKQVSDFIDSLPTPASRQILHFRYCDGLSWPQIESEMAQAGFFYSDRQLFRIHGKALNEARKKYTEGNYDQNRDT